MSQLDTALLNACLWDLRTQCEQQVRSLTAAQRLTDQYGARQEDTSSLRRRLLTELEGVLHLNALIRDSAEECCAMVQKTVPSDCTGDDAAR